MLTLQRLISSIQGTHGVLLFDKKPLCYTLELPWKYNAKNISCIPTGEYRAFKAQSPKFGSVVYISSVPDREGILIHSGNTLKDTRGCILVGLDTFDNTLLNSNLALKRLLKTVPTEFQLLVKGN